MKKKILIISAIVILSAIAFALYKYYQPQKNYSTSKPDFVFSINDLFSEFQKNEADATLKYVSSNSTLQINGILKEIKAESDSTVTLIITDTQTGNNTLYCNLSAESSTSHDIQHLEIDKPITVKGQCTGYQSLIDETVYMIRAGIVE